MTQLHRGQQTRDDVVPPWLVPYPVPKRIVDKLVAFALIALLLPVLLVVLIATATASRGRIFRREERVSRGRTFALLKFRTLGPGLVGDPSLLERDPANLTWAGRLLLKPCYLDELPQLFNVLRGDISLVGPRPWTPALVQRQVAEGRDYRLRVKAGLTGPAQVTKGVEGTRYEDLDLAYVEKCETLSGWALVRYDVGILLQTLRVLARGEGLTY